MDKDARQFFGHDQDPYWAQNTLPSLLPFYAADWGGAPVDRNQGSAVKAQFKAQFERFASG
jgi:hypothetical protein